MPQNILTQFILERLREKFFNVQFEFFCFLLVKICSNKKITKQLIDPAFESQQLGFFYFEFKIRLIILGPSVQKQNSCIWTHNLLIPSQES